jgi:hypothetical protein
MLIAGGEYPGERFEDGRVVVVKTHRHNVSHVRDFPRAVLLIRNPLDALLAEFNRQRASKAVFARQEEFQKYGRYDTLFFSDHLH